MASDTDLHAHVAFARRYGDPTNAFLNAFSAMARLESLIDDASDMKAVLDEKYPEDQRWHPWWGAEVMSYYAVGFVTCLEWHARSRIVDLFTYKPAAIAPGDISGRLGDKIISQMVAQNATVAQLIGASINLGRFSNYMSLITRVFKELGIEPGPHKWLLEPPEGNPILTGDDLERMENLFVFRNALVHEIGLDQLGHPNVRSVWNPDDALEVGHLALRLVRGIENALFRMAPHEFPNLLTDKGFPVPQIDTLEQQIHALEEKITKVEAQFLESNSISDESQAFFPRAIPKAKESYGAEVEFISSAPIFHSRYVDLRTPVRVQLLKGRVAYLEFMLDAVSTHWLIGEDSPDEAQ